MTSPFGWEFFSAEGHVIEPRDLFVDAASRRFAGRVPRIESRDDGDWIVVDGLAPRVIGFAGPFVAEKRDRGRTSKFGHRYGGAPPGAYDPVARVDDQRIDNVHEEVLYPGVAGWCHGIADLELKAEIFGIYNEWLAEEFVARDRNRYVGAGLLPMGHDVSVAIAEARRCVDLGLGTFQLPTVLPPEIDYDAYAHWAPLWHVLEEVGSPIAFHGGAGEDSQAFSHSFGKRVAVTKQRVADVAAALIFGGVARHHSGLRFVLARGGAGWIASTFRFLDHFWADHREWIEPALDEPPSAYFDRQFWAIFDDDPSTILTLPLLNPDHIMWGNDFPRTEGVWPNGVATLARDLAGVDEVMQRKLTRDNALALYAPALVCSQGS